jgi:hypothetical protein
MARVDGTAVVRRTLRPDDTFGTPTRATSGFSKLRWTEAASADKDWLAGPVGPAVQTCLIVAKPAPVHRRRGVWSESDPVRWRRHYASLWPPTPIASTTETHSLPGDYVVTELRCLPRCLVQLKIARDAPRSLGFAT